MLGSWTLEEKKPQREGVAVDPNKMNTSNEVPIVADRHATASHSASQGRHFWNSK